MASSAASSAKVLPDRVSSRVPFVSRLSANGGRSTLQPPPTLHTFPVKEVFVFRHEQGTLIEMENEVELLKRFNERGHVFKAWPVAPIPGLTTAFLKPWLLLVKTPSASDEIMFPALNDRFVINMEARVERADGTFSLTYIPTTRIANPYEALDTSENSRLAKLAAFKVDVPRSWRNDDGQNVELDLMSRFQTAPSIDSVEHTKLDDSTQQGITIQWDTFSLTFEAELAALRFLTEQHRMEDRGPSPRSVKAFERLLDFHNGWKNFYDLHNQFPHLQNPCLGIHRIPKLLVNKFKAFNSDHRAAFEGLSMIPDGLYFVNGCPGAGKTEWNMVVSALIQAKHRPGSKRRRSPILFLVDINKTVDDAADRYYNLCKAAGLNLRIIRMHGWPYEMRNSGTLNKTDCHSNADAEAEPDFTKKFLTTASLACHEAFHRNPNKAPTLDEAAWEYYSRHKDGCLNPLKKVLTRMESGEALSGADWKNLRNLVALLYRAVLAQTDFVATTPVAAYGNFSKLFKPDVIFVDEAPHARELTTLIPIAFYDPLAWIFTGDANQTRPFVKSSNSQDVKRQGLKWNPFADQLRYSTMGRAETVGAINSKLLVNNRAHANLQRLPSKMFYQGQMISGHANASSLYPPSTTWLKKHLESLGNSGPIDENRVVIRLKDSKEEVWLSSYWNPAHHKWLLQQVQKLLHDTNFRSAGHSDAPGTIMVATPYSTAVRQYHAEVKQWPQEWQDRIEVLTVDKAQGNKADVVFLDMVRTTKVGFMDDPKRLNVAITRARQAEIILMHYNMTWRSHGRWAMRSQFVSQVWDDAKAHGRLFTL